MIAALALAASAGACEAASDRASRAELDELLERRGTLVRAGTSAVAARGRYLKERVVLASSTGLRATGLVLHPATGAGCLPAVLLQNGREENAGVIERLPREFGDVVVLALDYPAELPYTIRLGDIVKHGDRLERAARRIAPLFLLGGAYLASRADVDSTRMALVATSFAVPFATAAAAADSRFANAAFIYGAGDMPAVLAANLALKPAAIRQPLARLALGRFAALAPERYVGLIAPRPVVMINGVDDPQMPRPAVERLFAAARPPKALIWLRTGHLFPADSALIRRLVDTAFARLPVLQHATVRPDACTARRAP